MIRGRLTLAERCAPRFGKVRTSRLSPAQANGIRYERKVHKALGALAKSLSATIEYNPWFHFVDQNGAGACSPDALLWLDSEMVVVVEVKYTWTPTAQVKLAGLYVPIVQAALGPKETCPLVICKNLTPDSPRPALGIRDFARPGVTVYQWRGDGRIEW